MPHIAFVSMSGFRVHERELLEYGMTLPGFSDRARALAELPALGLLTLAGMLPDDWTCSYRAPLFVDENLVEQIHDERPALVAISALTASIEEAYRLSDALRGRGVTTVLGGLHVSVCPEEARRQADAIVIGEGEAGFQQLLEDFARDSLVHEYGGGRSLPDAAPQWPLPRFDLLGQVSRYTLQTQRGCPLACDFCAASRLLGRFREKPIEHIQVELAAIRDLDPDPLIELADDNTFAGMRDFPAFLDAFRKAGVRWFTESDWRIGERPELLRDIAAAGCVQVLVGIESMVFRYPGMGRKQAELDHIMQSVEAIQEAGIAVNGCFIIGADGETRDSLDRLTEFLLTAPFAEVQLTIQTPFPGTELRRRLVREKRLLSERGWPYYSLFEVTYRPDRMTVEELEQGFREIATHVYGPAPTRRRRQLRLDIWKRNRRLHAPSSSR